ncbi:FAD binding domain-containing protein [Lichenicoccus roseus]|uniref:FAD binding domain-containing protein n=1 Tax=Lichenicoccus roseus TaxID=2683649 RepID=UPI00198103FA|nr:FAD binding domain-containing protein [Lichenicoccus roseus]
MRASEEPALDLHFVETLVRPDRRAALPEPLPGDAFVGGGSWLFSEPQTRLRRLIDLASFGWTPIEPRPEGLEIAATCRLAELAAFEPVAGWPAASLFRPSCDALWGSFKIHNVATVGGNLCLGLPAAPMAALATALQGVFLVWQPDGGDRLLAAIDFLTGPGETALRPGEILRSVTLPATALRRRAAIRQASLTSHGRSAALLIGTSDPGGAMSLTVTAAVRRPLRLDFRSPPDAAGLQAALSQRLNPAVLFDDLHGSADWKRHMTLRLAEDIRRELAA